jgi:hypothetical protein
MSVEPRALKTSESVSERQSYGMKTVIVLRDRLDT